MHEGHIDIGGFQGHPFAQNFTGFIDHCGQIARHDLFGGESAGCDGFFGAFRLYQSKNLRIWRADACAVRVQIKAAPSFLPKPAALTDAIGDLNIAFRRVALALCGFAVVPSDVQPGQIIHGMKAHWIAKLHNSGINLIGRGAVLHHMGGTIAIFAKNAVANKPRGIASAHGDFAQNFGQSEACCDHIIGGALRDNNFQQLHDICRAEEMQAEHMFTAVGDAGNFIYVDIACVGGQNRVGL